MWKLPWTSLVPDLVTTLTNPEEERPNSALAPSVTTTTSLTASRLNVNGGRWPPRCSPKNGLLKSAPSTDTLLAIPFWPLIVISSPSGPWTIDTLGVSFAKSRKLRPLLGRLATSFSLIWVEPSARVVSITGLAAVTSTSWLTAATCRANLRLIDCPTARLSPSRTSLVKPERVTVTRYGPSGSRTLRNRPSDAEVTPFSKLVSVFLIETVAPGNTPPVSSTTVPSMTPVVACDWASTPGTRHTLKHRSTRPTRQKRCIDFLLSSHRALQRSIEPTTLTTVASAYPLREGCQDRWVSCESCAP